MSLIELRVHEGKLIPVLLCEKCHKPIRSILDAMLFNDLERNKFIVCHKGTCDHGLDGSLEMRDILAQLVGNYIGVKFKFTEGFLDAEVKPHPGFQDFIAHLEG